MPLTFCRYVAAILFSLFSLSIYANNTGSVGVSTEESNFLQSLNASAGTAPIGSSQNQPSIPTENNVSNGNTPPPSNNNPSASSDSNKQVVVVASSQNQKSTSSVTGNAANQISTTPSLDNNLVSSGSVTQQSPSKMQQLETSQVQLQNTLNTLQQQIKQLQANLSASEQQLQQKQSDSQTPENTSKLQQMRSEHQQMQASLVNMQQQETQIQMRIAATNQQLNQLKQPTSGEANTVTDTNITHVIQPDKDKILGNDLIIKSAPPLNKSNSRVGLPPLPNTTTNANVTSPATTDSIMATKVIDNPTSKSSHLAGMNTQKSNEISFQAWIQDPAILLRTGFACIGLALLLMVLMFRSEKKKIAAQKFNLPEHGNPIETYPEDEDLAAEYDFMSTEEAIPARLDLARGYIEMGNYPAAREAIIPVLAKGDPQQKEEAKQLLKNIDKAETGS